MKKKKMLKKFSAWLLAVAMLLSSFGGVTTAYADTDTGGGDDSNGKLVYTYNWNWPGNNQKNIDYSTDISDYSDELIWYTETPNETPYLRVYKDGELNDLEEEPTIQKEYDTGKWVVSTAGSIEADNYYTGLYDISFSKPGTYRLVYKESYITVTVIANENAFYSQPVKTDENYIESFEYGSTPEECTFYFICGSGYSVVGNPDANGAYAFWAEDSDSAIKGVTVKHYTNNIWSITLDEEYVYDPSDFCLYLKHEFYDDNGNITKTDYEYSYTIRTDAKLAGLVEKYLKDGSTTKSIEPVAGNIDSCYLMNYDDPDADLDLVIQDKSSGQWDISDYGTIDEYNDSNGLYNYYCVFTRTGFYRIYDRLSETYVSVEVHYPTAGYYYDKDMQDSIPENLLSNDDGSNYWGDPDFTYTGSVESFYFIYYSGEGKSAYTTEDGTVQLYNGDYHKISPEGVTITKVKDFSIDDYEAYEITLDENYAYSGNICILISGYGYYGINTLSEEESTKNTIELRRKISTANGKFNYIRTSYDIDVGEEYSFVLYDTKNKKEIPLSESLSLDVKKIVGVEPPTTKDVDVDISTSGTEYTCIFQHSGSYKLYEETYDTSFYVEVTPDAGYYSDEKGTKKLDQSETYDNEGQQFLYSDNNTTFYFINKEPDTYSVKTDSEGNVQRYVYDKILGDIEDDSNSVTITPVTVDENSSSDMVVYKITLDDDFALGTGFYIIITDEVEDINYYKFIRTRLADGSLVCSQEDDESYVRKLDNVETKSSYTAFFGTYSYDVNADTEPDAESANAVTETPSIQKYADDGWVDVEEADKATISPAEDAGYYTYKFMNPGKYRFVYNDTYVTVTVSKSIDRLVYTDEFDYYNNNYNLDDARYYDEFQYTVSTKDSGAIFFGTGIPNSKEVTPVSTKPVIQKQNGESWSEATEDDATLTEVDEHPNFYIYNFKTAGQYRYAYTNGDEDPSYIYVTVISCLGEFSASGDTNDALEHTWDYQTFTYNELKKEFYFICQKVDYLENKLKAPVFKISDSGDVDDAVDSGERITVDLSSEDSSTAVYKVTLKDVNDAKSIYAFIDYADKNDEWYFELKLDKEEILVSSGIASDSTYAGVSLKENTLNLSDLSDTTLADIAKITSDSGDVSLSLKADTIEVDASGNVTNVAGNSSSEKIKETQTAVNAMSKSNEMLSKLFSAEYLDLSLSAIVTKDNTKIPISEISESAPITVTVPLTEDMKAADLFYVLRYHDGKCQVLDATRSGDYVSFETNLFSTYAIIYKNSNTAVENMLNDTENPVTWSATTSSFIYDGNQKTCDAALNLPDGYTPNYIGNKATSIGTYTVQLDSITYTDETKTPTTYDAKWLTIPDTVKNGYTWTITAPTNNGGGAGGGAGGGGSNTPSDDTTTVDTDSDVTVDSVRSGSEITIGNETYLVTDTDENNHTVTYTGIAEGAGTVKTVKIPSSVTIDDVSYTVTSISANALSGNKKITSVTIPSTVTSIGKNAFKNCKKLKSITIPSTVTTIGAAAFYNCKSLTKVVIPKNVKSVGAKAFANCTKLTSVTFKGTKVTKIGSKAFYNISKKAVIKVPSSKKKAYKKLLKESGYTGKIK